MIFDFTHSLSGGEESCSVQLPIRAAGFSQVLKMEFSAVFSFRNRDGDPSAEVSLNLSEPS